MAVKTNAMELAKKYIDTHKVITPQILQEKLGISRASSYNAIRKYYNKEESKDVSQRTGTNKPTKGDQKKLRKSRQENSTRTRANTSVSTEPRFELCGIHKELVKRPELEGKLLWGDVYYKGICPVCASEVKLYKTAIVFSKSGKREIEQDFRGVCSKCDVNVSIHRSRK